MKKLYFKEKILKFLDHYPILDENGREAYYVDQDFSLVSYRGRVSDKNGHEIFRIKREIISFLPRYTVDFYDGKTLTVLQKIAFLKKKIEVYLDGEKLTLTGDMINLNYQVENGSGKTIGTLYKKFFAMSDTYELSIYDEKYEAELIALTICLNNINDLQDNSN